MGDLASNGLNNVRYIKRTRTCNACIISVHRSPGEFLKQIKLNNQAQTNLLTVSARVSPS